MSQMQASWALARSTPSWIRTAGIALGASLFIAVCSHIALPLWFTPVPLTLQPFAVLLVGLLLTPRNAAVACLAYLAEGALGLPVFAPGLAFSAGLAHLLGPTGGYLMSYPVAAPLASFLWRRSPRSYWMALASAIAGNALILASGAVWLAGWTHASMRATLSLAVLPFLPGDALKVAAAAALVCTWQRFNSRIR